MNTAADTDRGVGAVHLLKAVFCVDCETISNSPHDVCSICGSHSLVNLFRIVGGTLRRGKVQSTAKTPKYNLELIAKVHKIPATELSLVIDSMTRLAQTCSAVESLHINVESVFDIQDVSRAA